MPGKITEEILKSLRQLVPDPNITVDDVVVGLGYTGVKLSTGHVGLSFTFQTEMQRSQSKLHERAGSLAGSKAMKLANMARSWDLGQCVVGVATMNALSSIAMEKKSGDYNVSRGNICGEICFRKEDVVTVVGNIRPLVNYFRQRVKRIYVLERDLARRESYTLPDTASEEILPRSTVVIITGTTLVNGTLEHLIDLCARAKKAREIAVVGATAGVLPDPLFRRGVTVVGGARVLDSEKLLQIVAEGGGTHELKRTFEFINLRPRKQFSPEDMNN